MNAILIAIARLSEFPILSERYPACLLPLVDRPFIQHVVEYLVNQGVTAFDVVLDEKPEAFERLLGDGRRWGAHIDYHLVKRGAGPYRLLHYKRWDPDGPLLLAHADRLPQFGLAASRPAGDRSVLLCAPGAPASPDGWSGWAWLAARHAAGPVPDNTAADLFARLAALPADQVGTHPVASTLGARSGAELLASQRRVLAGEHPGLMTSAKTVEAHLWIARNVSLHPTARLSPPVYIGENCRIGRAVTLGPNVVVGHDCILDEKSTLTDTAVFAGSFVGPDLELSGLLVDRNCIAHVGHATEIAITDNFILDSLSGRPIYRFGARAVSQAVAVALLLVLSPLWLAIAALVKVARRGPLVSRRTVVRLPAHPGSGRRPRFDLLSFLPPAPDASVDEPPRLPASPRPGWRDLLLRCLPALFNVARGELRFVGVAPRSDAEVDALPPDWRAIYLQSKAGIVTEAMVNFGPAPTEDDLYSAETIYSVSADWKYDLAILGRYFGQLFGLRAKPESENQGPSPDRHDDRHL